MIVGVLAIITMIYCYIVVGAAFMRSGVSSTGNYPQMGGLWRLWKFAGSDDFVHPQRGLIVGGMYVSLVLLILIPIGIAVAVSAAKSARNGNPPSAQSDKQ